MESRNELSFWNTQAGNFIQNPQVCVFVFAYSLFFSLQTKQLHWFGYNVSTTTGQRAPLWSHNRPQTLRNNHLYQMQQCGLKLTSGKDSDLLLQRGSGHSWGCVGALLTNCRQPNARLCLSEHTRGKEQIWGNSGWYPLRRDHLHRQGALYCCSYQVTNLTSICHLLCLYNW